MKSFLFSLLLIGSFVYADEQRVSLPNDYRQNFIEYLSLDRIQNHDQFIRLFANDVAMQGKNAAGQLPNGSVLVAEVYSVLKNEDGSVKSTMLNRRVKDQLKLIAVMEKQDAFGKKPASAIDTGNWDFGAFTPNGGTAKKSLDACRACHTPLRHVDYIFSGEHLP